MNPTAVSNPIRVFIADDSELVRRGIASVLSASASPRIEVVGEASTAGGVLEGCLRTTPDVVLLDIRFPDGTGLEACRQLAQALPRTGVIMLTSYSNDGYLYEAIASGAQGYLMKEIDPAGLTRAVADVQAGRSILDPESTARVMRMMRTQRTPQGGGQGGALGSLSVQERKVLALVASGRTNKEIGEELGLSDNTVKNYLGSVFEKLQVKRRSQAAAVYVQSSPSSN